MKKAEIRKIVTAERSQLSELDFAEREMAILSLLRPLLREGSIVASFKAIPHRKEISLDSLEGSFLSLGWPLKSKAPWKWYFQTSLRIPHGASLNL